MEMYFVRIEVERHADLREFNVATSRNGSSVSQLAPTSKPIYFAEQIKEKWAA